MKNDIIKKYLDIINNEADEIFDTDNSNFYLYALKVKNNKNSKNPMVSLSYQFYNCHMNNSCIKDTLETIIKYTKCKYFDNPETEYSPYTALNPKTVIDYIPMQELDFSVSNIQDGTANNLDPNNYKIQYLLNEMYSSSTQITTNQAKNFTGIKYTVLRCSCKEHEIIVINKGNPLYKPKGMMFALNLDETDKTSIEYKEIKQQLFKVPFYPGILIIDNLCLFIDDKIEILFGFSEQVKMLRDEKLTEISESNIINPESFSVFKQFAEAAKNYNYFSTYDPDRLDFIKNKIPEAIKLLSDIGLRFEDNMPKIEEARDAEILTAYLCHALAQDAQNTNEYLTIIKGKKIN